ISNTEQPLTKRKVSPRFVSKFSVQTFVDKDAELGIGVRVGHFATVHSNVKVGNNVRIEDGCRIYEGCEIGDYSIVGPNAVLRPHSKLGHHTIFGTLSCCEGHTSIGDYTTIHAQCQLNER